MPSFTSSLLPFPSHFLVVPPTHTHFLLPFFLLFIYFCNNKQCLARQNKRLIKDNCSEKLSRRVENSFAFSCRVLWIQASATINKVLLFCLLQLSQIVNAMKCLWLSYTCLECLCCVALVYMLMSAFLAMLMMWTGEDGHHRGNYNIQCEEHLISVMLCVL